MNVESRGAKKSPEDRLEARFERLAEEIVQETSLFRSHPELGKPTITTQAVRRRLRLYIGLSMIQADTLDELQPPPDMQEFCDQLRHGLERLATQHHLELVWVGEGIWEVSELVFSEEVPIAYRAVFETGNNRGFVRSSTTASRLRSVRR